METCATTFQLLVHAIKKGSHQTRGDVTTSKEINHEEKSQNQRNKKEKESAWKGNC